MTVISKQLFDEVAADLTCQQLFHPWSKTCVGALPRIFIESWKGSFNFYSIIYLAQIAMQVKNVKSKKMWIKLGEYFIRSSTLGFIVPFTFMTFNCLFRLFGLQMSYYTSILVPLTLSGSAIYLEPPSRRGLVINVFVNQMVEYCLRGLSNANYLNITKTKQVLMFMVGSSILFYLMRKEGEKPRRTNLFWLYTAEKVNNNKTEESENVCPHKGSCRSFIFKGSYTYFSIGLAISLAKLILPKIRSPIRALSSIRSKHFKMALFFGSYIGIYRAVICYLCRETGKDSSLYALPAGFISGLSMVFNPNLSMAIASITAALKLYSTVLYEKKILPENIPLPEITYCLCQGILFGSRLIDSKTCPSYIRNLTDTVGYGHCEKVCKRVIEIAEKSS